MAERVGSFDFVGNERYPWKDWTDGSVWRVTKGEDFPGGVNSFRVHLYSRAKVQGLKVRTATDGDSVIFQFYPREQSDA